MATSIGVMFFFIFVIILAIAIKQDFPNDEVKNKWEH